jgi:P27 family predicted phage terminase small subunit
MANRKGGGRGGRKPAPTALKIAGNVRADRIPVGEPKAPSGVPTPPIDLEGYELEGWARFIEDVERLGLLSPVDRHNAFNFAVAYGRAREARDTIKEHGLLIDGAHGGMASNPAVGILERAERAMLSILSLYGLSPSDRSRLRATEQTEEDPLDKFLRENHGA